MADIEFVNKRIENSCMHFRQSLILAYKTRGLLQARKSHISKSIKK